VKDYLHTVILFIAILIFGFVVYATSDHIGSLDRFYDILQRASEDMPIERNHEGSYLTFRSVDGLIFAIDLFVAGFSTVWLDQAYWQRAIASRPETSVRAYLLGGVAWYGIPFGFSTAMGLGCAALTYSPSFPTYPEPLSAAQNGAGLSAPASSIALMGKGGAVLMLILLFMAVTSATSAELIAVSSLLTFDVYKTYIKPDAPSYKLVQVSHLGIILYGVILAAFCCILNAVGLTLTWLLTVLGVMVGGASVPVGLVLLWKRMSTTAAIAAPWIGLSAGLIAWFVATWKLSGEINVTTTGNTTNAVAGNVTSWGTGVVIAVTFSFLFPKKYVATDPVEIERFNKIHGTKTLTGESATPPPVSNEAEKSAKEKEAESATEPTDVEKQEPVLSKPAPTAIVPTGNDMVDYLESSFMEPMDPEDVRKGTQLATWANVIFLLVAIILVPFTLFGTSYICEHFLR
jgi:Na+/proline symporter